MSVYTKREGKGPKVAKCVVLKKWNSEISLRPGERGNTGWNGGNINIFRDGLLSRHISHP